MVSLDQFGRHRWSEWRKKSRKPAEIKRFGGAPAGSPRGYFPLFEPIWLAPKIVNCLITKRDCRSYFLFLWYGELLTRRWRTMTR